MKASKWYKHWEEVVAEAAMVWKGSWRDHASSPYSKGVGRTAPQNSQTAWLGKRARVKAIIN